MPAWTAAQTTYRGEVCGLGRGESRDELLPDQPDTATTRRRVHGRVDAASGGWGRAHRRRSRAKPSTASPSSSPNSSIPSFVSGDRDAGGFARSRRLNCRQCARCAWARWAATTSRWTRSTRRALRRPSASRPGRVQADQCTRPVYACGHARSHVTALTDDRGVALGKLGHRPDRRRARASISSSSGLAIADHRNQELGAAAWASSTDCTRARSSAVGSAIVAGHRRRRRRRTSAHAVVRPPSSRPRGTTRALVRRALRRPSPSPTR